MRVQGWRIREAISTEDPIRDNPGYPTVKFTVQRYVNILHFSISCPNCIQSRTVPTKYKGFCVWLRLKNAWLRPFFFVDSNSNKDLPFVLGPNHKVLHLKYSWTSCVTNRHGILMSPL